MGWFVAGVMFVTTVASGGLAWYLVGCFDRRLRACERRQMNRGDVEGGS